MTQHPKVTIEKTPFALFIEAFTFLVLVLLIVLPIMEYSSLPDRIPTHFNAQGNADGYSEKAMIWLLPGLAWVIIPIIFLLSKQPHLHNYPIKVTQENAKTLFTYSTQMSRILNLIIGVSFLYIVYRSIAIAKGEVQNLRNYFLPVFLCAIFALIIFYLVKMYALKKS